MVARRVWCVFGLWFVAATETFANVVSDSAGSAGQVVTAVLAVLAGLCFLIAFIVRLFMWPRWLVPFPCRGKPG